MLNNEEFQNDMDLLDAHAREIEARNAKAEAAAADINDFDDDLEFRTLDGVQRTADRYIFFPGQLMEPRILAARKDFAVLGGEYFGTEYPALALSKFALFRARITPVTLRPRPLPVDEKIKNREVEVFEGVAFANGERSSARVQYVKSYPGDQLESIVFGAREGSGKGYTEITALQGKEYKLPETKAALNEIQRRIFPNWTEILSGKERLPATLRGLVEIISLAYDKYKSDETMESVCKEMLASCDAFRLWGVSYLQIEGTRIRAGVNQQGGYVHRYSQVGELLLEQLEMKRENLLAQNDSPVVVTAPVSSQSAEAMAAAAASMAETAKANTEFLEKLIANGVQISEQLSPKPDAKAAKPEEKKK